MGKKMNLHFGREAHAISRLEGWTAEDYPDSYAPAEVIFKIPGDHSGFTEKTKRLRLDARIVELRFVLANIVHDSNHTITDAYYSVSTEENPIEPINQLLD